MQALTPILPRLGVTTLLLAGSCSLAAQTSWQPESNASPGPRSYPRTCELNAPGEMLLFGGYVPGVRGSSETWTYSGKSWTRRNPAHSPTGRWEHGLVYDRNRNRAVLFGGQLSSGASSSETWEWNASDWQLITSQGPTPRRQFGFVFDEAMACALLFGGSTGNQSFADTWCFDGRTWTQLSPPHSPPALRNPSLAYDNVRSRAVLFGGSTAQGPSDQTWEWDGADWRQLAPLVSPAPREAAVLVFDPIRNRTILFGGIRSGSMLRDTWEWDGSRWTAQQVIRTPPGRCCAAVTFDRQQERARIFGGYGGAFLGDAWTYATLAPTTLVDLGKGCTGTSGTPTLRVVAGRSAWIGDTYSIRCSNLTQGSVPFLLFGLKKTAPIDLSVIGMPSCSMYAHPDVVVVLSEQNGVARLDQFLPLDPFLVGQEYSQQVITSDPGANSLGWSTSNGIRLRVGRR